MKRPSVSVVIPTFNSGPLVVQAVESVLAQTIAPEEIIVVDDGSCDDTRQRLAPYRNSVHYLFQANQGVAAARNRGTQRATGEFVAFLDADDVWHPRKLELQLEVMARHPELGLLGTRVFDWPTEAIPGVSVPPPGGLDVVPWQRLAIKNYFVTSSVLVRRSVLEKVGAFDTDLHGPEDYDLWLRIAGAAAAANLDLPLTGYRTVSGSLSKQAATMETGMRRILQKLDAGGAWQGRWLLRRKAHSYCDYSCAYMHGAAGCQGIALARLLRSFAWYPLPYCRGEVRMPLARPKLLVMICLRMLRVAQTEPRPPVAATSGALAAAGR